MMKKLLGLLLVLCIALGGVHILAEEEQSIPETWQIVYDWHDNTSLFWAEIDGETCTIKAVANYQDDELFVPYKENLCVKEHPSYNFGDPITVDTFFIDKDALKKGAELVATITFAEGYEVLPDGLCEGMTNLKTVNLPESVYAIGNDCFKDCENLKTVTGLHNGIGLGRDAFTGTKVDLNNISEDVVSDTENYIYPAKEVFKKQSDIVELTSDALSWFSPDNDPESEKYDFTTTDKEIIEAVMKAVNACRYKEVKGTLASDGTAFLITVKYSDGTEAYYNFKQSTVYIDNAKYQLLDDDYWNLSNCLKYSKQNILKKERLFSDVAADSEYHEAIKTLSELGIMQGYEDGTFKTEGTLTRAEAAAILVRLLNLEEEVETGETEFSDVPESHWASGYVNKAVENGIIIGMGDGTFKPEEKVTYHQLVKMLICALGYEGMAVYNGGWNNGGYIFAAEKIGLIESEPENNDMPITRGETAQLVYKTLAIELMDQSCDGGKQYGEFYQLVGKTILTEYWGIE